MSFFLTLWCRSLQSSKRSHTLLWTCWGRVLARSGVCQSCLLSHFDGSQNSPFLPLLHVLMPSGDSENVEKMVLFILMAKRNTRHTYFNKASTCEPINKTIHHLLSNVQWQYLHTVGEQKAPLTWNALLSMCSPSLLPSRLMITCLPYSLRSAVKCLDNNTNNQIYCLGILAIPA